MNSIINGTEKQIKWAESIKKENIKHLEYMIASHTDLVTGKAMSPTVYKDGKYEVLHPEDYVETWKSFQSEKLCEMILNWWEKANDARLIIAYRDNPTAVMSMIMSRKEMSVMMDRLKNEFKEMSLIK